MRLLLDTHAFIWATVAPEKLSETARNLFANSNNSLLLSYSSIWEMQIKLALGKLKLQVPLPELVKAQQNTNNIDLLAIDLAHIYKLNDLPNYHRDPFDRLIIAQAIVENTSILSIDEAFDQYPAQRIWNEVSGESK